MSEGDSVQTAASTYQLALAWRQRGRADAAQASLEKTLAIDPGYVPALHMLVDLHLERGDLLAARGALQSLAAVHPENETLRQELGYLDRLIARHDFEASAYEAVPFPSSADGKIRFRAWNPPQGHRGGWAEALLALAPLHNDSGVLFEGFLEDPFGWQHKHEARSDRRLLQILRDGRFAELATAEEKGIIPFLTPWVGFWHNPTTMPAWFHFHESPQTIFQKSVWRDSMVHCQGLFTLSEHLARQLRQLTGKPVSALIYPSEIPQLCFDFDRFCANPRKQIVQIGWWLRSLNAIYQLPLPADNLLGYRKIRLVPDFFADADAYLEDLLAIEAQEQGLQLTSGKAANTAEVRHLANDAYDELLSQNIAFLYLYDAAANTTVVECLARATPLLVNRLPAVEEYLGADYPLYYDGLDQAADFALDLNRLYAAHQHMQENEIRAQLSAEAFRQAFEVSEVYQLL